MLVQEVGKDDVPQLKLIANLLVSSKKVIVVTGAGISTNCGIPVSQLFWDAGVLNEVLIWKLGFSLREWPLQSD